MAACLAAAVVSAAPPTRVPLPSSPPDTGRLLRSTAWVRSLDEADLRKLVPGQSGLRFVGCPNCTSGKQEGQLAWSPERPEEVYCRYCSHRYPSPKYPQVGSITATAPSGKACSYPYWQNAEGYRFHFQARRDALVQDYLTDRTRELALLYVGTQDRTHARRAAVLLDQFARVFPDYCYKYDYPFRQKEFDNGVPPAEKLRPGFRTARWDWWAYLDIPTSLIEAYDWIRESGAFEELSREAKSDVAARIENQLFREAASGVLKNTETLSNMSPTTWRSLATLGRAVREPRYVHEAVERLERMLQTQFFYDGSWPEGAPSYHSQTVGGLRNLIALLDGYSDPEGYRGIQGNRFDRLDLNARLPALQRARRALDLMALPDGRMTPVHDTWSFNKLSARSESLPFLLPALGHGCLAAGRGAEQLQAHLTWSGAYGHAHGDNLSLLLFSGGREQLSDLGYTHTRYRSWTLATAAHNTVVIDGKNQSANARDGATDGSLRFFDATSPLVQVVSANGERGYRGTASRYRRTVLLIRTDPARPYLVDLFEVTGGKVHDFFLHGDADAPGVLETAAQMAPAPSLLPVGMKWEATRNEGESDRILEPWYAYGFLRNLRECAATSLTETLTFRPSAGSATGVRVHLAQPEPGTRLYVGGNPAIRGADEDDSRLDSFLRPFAMLRHEAAGRDGSAFLTVIEPFSGPTRPLQVRRLSPVKGAHRLEIREGDRVDLISVHSGRDADLREARLSVESRSPGRAPRGYVLNTTLGGSSRLSAVRPQPGKLLAVGEDHLLIEAPKAPPIGAVVRLRTGDGWVYPFTVAATESAGAAWRLKVQEGPGMQYHTASRELELTAYPQRKHVGAVTVDWVGSASTSP